ncbi:MAG: Cof-type HAD-IIB family hydrolase [Lautropia sp.]|nr:MAG: Cof-type HAD-IIB family hydrolase [Lautropia sp.]
MRSHTMTQALKDRIRIAFFDIDDTIYSKATGQLSPGTEKAFAGLQRRGVIPAIASGRARYVFPRPLEEVIGRLGLEYFVTINGQLNLRGSSVLSDYPFAPQDLARITGYFLARGMPVVYSERQRMSIVSMTHDFEAALSPITRDYPLDQHHVEGDPVYQMIIGYDESQQPGIDASGILDNGRFKTVRWHEDAVDLLMTAGSKVRGIRDVIASLGLTLDNVMVFGDSLNDIEMLSEAGYAVAMANGHPHVKQYADYVAPAQAEDGVHRALLALDMIDPD